MGYKGRRSPRGPQSRPEQVSTDWLIKALLEGHPTDIAAWLAGETPEEVSSVDPVLARISLRVADHLWSLRFKSRPPMLLHVEFQLRGSPEIRSEDPPTARDSKGPAPRKMRQDATIPERMAMYLLMMQRLLRTAQHEQSRPASVVVYLDRQLYREDPGLIEIEGEMSTSLRCTYRVVKLWTVDPEPILAKDCPGLWPFVLLMNGKPEELLVKSKVRIVGAPESVATIESKKELLAVLGGFASRVIGDRGVLDHFIREITDMGDNYVFDRLIEMGREQGAKSTARNDVLRILRRKFGDVGDLVERTIEGIQDPETIERLVEEAAVAPTLDAFLTFLPPSSR